MDRSWEDFWEFVSRHPSPEVGALVAHLARWHDSCTERLTELAAGRSVPPIDADEMNAIWSEADRGLDRDHAERRCLESLDRLRQAIAAVPAERWSERLLWQVEVDTWNHYAEHRDWLGPAG